MAFCRRYSSALCRQCVSIATDLQLSLLHAHIWLRHAQQPQQLLCCQFGRGLSRYISGLMYLLFCVSSLDRKLRPLNNALNTLKTYLFRRCYETV